MPRCLRRSSSRLLDVVCCGNADSPAAVPCFVVVWSSCRVPFAPEAITPTNRCRCRCSSIILKPDGCFGFLVKTHIYKLVRTLSFRQRRMHLSWKLIIHPNCSQVETILCAHHQIKLAKFFLCITCKYTTNLIICGTSFKKESSPSYFFPSLLISSRSAVNRVAFVMLSPLPFLSKKSASFWKTLDTLCSAFLSWAETLLCMLQVIRVSRKNVHLFTEGTL